MTEIHFALIALTGLTVAAAAWWIGSVAVAPRDGGRDEGRFEEERRGELREQNVAYRWLEPWIDELVELNRQYAPRAVASMKADLPATDIAVPWRAAEFIAVKQVEALLAGVAATGFVGLLSTAQTGLMFGGAIVVFYFLGSLSDVRRRARKRRTAMRRRFASAFDLIALMLEVGATFPDALRTVAAESKGHPLGDELDRLVQSTEMGSVRADALLAFGERMADPDIQEMMASITEAEELGAPIAETMRTQNDQIRMKRVSWAERTAEEAKVQLVFPAMIIMVACLIIVAAPFVLSALFASQGY